MIKPALQMVSEDFAYYQQQLPGFYFFVGIKNEAKGITAENIAAADPLLTLVPDHKVSIREVFAESVGKFADRPAYSCMGKTITFSELDTLSAAFGAGGVAGSAGAAGALASVGIRFKSPPPDVRLCA